MKKYKYDIIRFVSLELGLFMVNGGFKRTNWLALIGVGLASIGWGLAGRYEAKEEDRTAC